MYECERLFGADRGTQVQELVELATGELCPCKQGRACPLASNEASRQRGS